MHKGVKLLTGLAATVLLARGAMVMEGNTILGRMAWHAQQAMLDAGVQDGSLSFRQGSPHDTRSITLSGTADAPTRAAIIAKLKQQSLLSDVQWEAR